MESLENGNSVVKAWKNIESLPEIKESNHCSCAKYKAEIHVWHLK